MMRHLLKLLLLLVTLNATAQQGGMWIPSLLEGMNENEMKSLGMKMSAKDIYDVNKSSLKDAVPHFNGGCTSEVISPKGLLLTNHHCGYSQIQSHSSIDKDYIQDGFWARTMAEELPNKNLSVTFIIKIVDVTKEVMQNVASLKSEVDKQNKIAENIEITNRNFMKENWQDSFIRTFYEGNQYMLFVTETFKDVRLVGTPPSSIGKFGSDTDNWVWPRHTGDFMLFRIYADTNNRPAEYSSNNVPYTPKHYFPISLSGVEENDFTMVFGYPGRTQEYLPAIAVEQIINDLNPAKIGIRDLALKEQDAFMRQDQAIKIKYASKFASTANYWKKWIGESQGLKKTNAVAIKKQQEKEFTDRVIKAGKVNEYGNLLQDFEKYYTQIAPYALARDFYTETIRNVEVLTFNSRLYSLEQLYHARGENAMMDRLDIVKKSLQGSFRNFEKQVDAEVFEKVIQYYATKAPQQFLPAGFSGSNFSQLKSAIYNHSQTTSSEGIENLLSGNDASQIIERLNQDPAYQLTKQIIESYFENVAGEYNQLQTEIAALQRTYMKAIVELSPKESRIFPDANSTLRVTYGQVKGYNPSDAVQYSPVTYLDGVMEKYVPGDYEFDVPEKLRDLYESKDFGIYADANGKLPVNFIATNHTTGGNSGSPAIDANGNLIGLNFDRVWEGTMSDIYYDPSICRNIMVDARYILFIIDKYADAKHLIDEMKLVYPKKKSKKKNKK